MGETVRVEADALLWAIARSNVHAAVLDHIDIEQLTSVFYAGRALAIIPDYAGISLPFAYTALGCAVCMIRNAENTARAALADRMLGRLLARKPNVNAGAYRDMSASLSIISLLLNGSHVTNEKIFTLFRAGASPLLAGATRDMCNGFSIMLSWRHWHCSRAATALIGVRRFAARGVMRAVPRDVVRLVVQAVVDTRY